MTYLILVTGPPYGTQNSYTGFLFSRSLLKLKHNLNSVFFYFDGVLNSNCMVNPANDEFNLVKAWCKLSISYNFSLNVCHSAAMRRGMVKKKKSTQSNKDSLNNLNKCFKFTSLIKLGIALQKSDKFMQF